MYSQKVSNLKEVKYVISNLNKDAVFELKTLFGKDYKNQAMNIVTGYGNDLQIIKLESTNEPVGVFGIVPQPNSKAGGIFFLTTDNLHKGNKIKLIREARKQIAVWEEKYKLIMDSCLKENKTIVKWLTLMGFKPSKFQDEQFQIYYKGDINEYKY